MQERNASGRLRAVVQLQDQAVHAAARALRTANERLDRQLYSERLLEEARASQLELASAEVHTGSSALHLKLVGNAIENLGRGLVQLTQSTALAKRERDQRAAELLSLRQRQEALERLVERRRLSENLAADRVAQYEVDDILGSRVLGQPKP
ncbi:MAG: flagellar export protein FliJ [Gammaproteobacteria bacterium]|jgi:flagellar export protein FliJ